MYFEESKKNVMALLRQNGSPSLFLTLSCAEYSWETLLKEIVEHVEGKEVSMDYIKEMAPQKKNKLISENVVLSTVHFQKRIEKELKLMTFPKFLDDNCPFSLIIIELNFNRGGLLISTAFFGYKTLKVLQHPHFGLLMKMIREPEAKRSN